jgi:NAD dependent epimerase/dehydratase family enzyme
MRVLLLGATGNLGSRLVPALIAHHHVLTILVRNTEKLRSLISPALLELVDSVVEGDATDSDRIKQTIKQHNIEAIVDVAGNQVLPWKEYLLPKIGKAICDAAVEVGKERGKPIRVWVTTVLILMRAQGSEYSFAD